MFSGTNPMFRNNVVLHLANGVARVPFSCRFKPGLPGQSPDDGEDDFDEYEDDGDAEVLIGGGAGDTEMYVMSVWRAGPGPNEEQLLLEKRSDTANVSPGAPILDNSVSGPIL